METKHKLITLALSSKASHFCAFQLQKVINYTSTPLEIEMLKLKKTKQTLLLVLFLSEQHYSLYTESFIMLALLPAGLQGFIYFSSHGPA